MENQDEYERRHSVFTREKLYAAVALFASLVLVSVIPAHVLVGAFGGAAAHLDNRINILDVGVAELSKDRDGVLARLEDVTTAMNQQIDAVRSLTRRLDACQREAEK